MSADTASPAPVPTELVDTAIGLVWRAQDALCEVDMIVEGFIRLEGAVELLRPHSDMIDDDDISNAWHRTAGVHTLMDLLAQIGAVIEHRTGIACAHWRPLPETNNAADEWREASGDGR